MAKVAVAGAWLLGIVAILFLDPDTRAAATARLLVGVLVGVHAIECLVFLPRLRRAEGSLAGQLLKTFVFGIFHIRELAETRSEASP